MFVWHLSSTNVHHCWFYIRALGSLCFRLLKFSWDNHCFLVLIFLWTHYSRVTVSHFQSRQMAAEAMLRAWVCVQLLWHCREWLYYMNCFVCTFVTCLSGWKDNLIFHFIFFFFRSTCIFIVACLMKFAEKANIHLSPFLGWGGNWCRTPKFSAVYLLPVWFTQLTLSCK